MKYPNPALSKYQLAGVRHLHGPNSRLSKVVYAILSCLIDTKQTFTAYNVTIILRGLYPTRTLPHYGIHGSAGVNPEVHRQMKSLMSEHGYTTFDWSRGIGGISVIAYGPQEV